MRDKRRYFKRLTSGLPIKRRHTEVSVPTSGSINAIGRHIPIRTRSDASGVVALVRPLGEVTGMKSKLSTTLAAAVG
ncbi:MAG: hypothetical protein WAN75_47980, partial [Xanthobacteraceae bacterium]